MIGSTEVERTKFLSILCVLSGIHALYGCVTGLTTALDPPDVDTAFIEDLFQQLDRFSLPLNGMQEDVREYYRNLMLDLGNYGAATFLFFAIQMIAVYMIYHLNRIGFTLYILAQIGLACAPVIFGGFNRFGQLGFALAVFWNAVWIVMYATQLKNFPK